MLKEISSEALLLQLLLVALPKVEVSVQILGGDKGTREELVCSVIQSSFILVADLLVA